MAVQLPQKNKEQELLEPIANKSVLLETLIEDTKIEGVDLAKVHSALSLAVNELDSLLDNADTEKMMRTIKKECIWIKEFKDILDAKEELIQWINFYNSEYIHLSLNYKSPNEWTADYYKSLKNLIEAA